MRGRLMERKASVGQRWKGKFARANSEGQDRLAMTRRDGVTRGRAATFMLGDGVTYFRSEHSVRFSTTYHPLLRRSRYAHGAAQGAAEGVNGVECCTGCPGCAWCAWAV